jgi:hypothetical protein
VRALAESGTACSSFAILLEQASLTLTLLLASQGQRAVFALFCLSKAI